MVFVALLAPAILAQRADVPPWWTLGALTGVLLLPVVLSATSFLLPPAALQGLASATALLYIVALLTLPIVQSRHIGVHDTAPWILGVTATGTTAAALAWRARWVWPYVVAIGALVTLDRVWTAAVPLTLVGVQDGAYACFFCAVFATLALGARGSGRAVDQARRAALHTAAEAASSRAAERERQRINALVHDEVLSTLLLASRTENDLPEPMRDGARRALARLSAVLDEDEGAPPLGTRALAARVRAGVADLAPQASVSVDLRWPGPVPGRIGESFVTATSEAVRNALAHGGEAVTLTVGIHADGARVVVTVADDGAGFDPGSVPSNRLGIAGSISGRMRAVGGAALVRSSAGTGTEVRLSWPEP